MAADPLEQVTPLLITFNEEANIGRTLAGLSWARRIVVIDSGSTDGTLPILRRQPAVEVVQRPFDSFADQCNHGLSLIATPWCLSLDADHVVPQAFVEEMAQLLHARGEELDAVLTPFRYLVHGRALRGTLLPPRFNLVRIGGGQYVNDGHAHRFLPSGRTATLRSAIDHDDRKPLSRWLAAQAGYVMQECDKLQRTPLQQLSRADRLRRLHVIAPFAVPLICLVWHRGILDGWRGWYYAFQRMVAELLLSLMLWDRATRR